MIHISEYFFYYLVPLFSKIFVKYVSYFCKIVTFRIFKTPLILKMISSIKKIILRFFSTILLLFISLPLYLVFWFLCPRSPCLQYRRHLFWLYPLQTLFSMSYQDLAQSLVTNVVEFSGLSPHKLTYS